MHNSNLQMSTDEWPKKSKVSKQSQSSTGPEMKKWKWQILGLLKQLSFNVPAMGEKLVPLVERGELRLAHDGPLLT